jgi:hypothetical protein
MCAFVVESQTRADSRRQSLVDQIYASASRIVYGIAHRTLFDGRCRSRNADNEMPALESIGHTADERAQHLLRHFEIVDRSRTNWAVDFDSARLTSEEPKGLVPDGDNFTVVAIDGDYRRLIQHDTVVRTVNESIDSAQIYSEVIFEEHLDELHGDGSSSKYWQVPGKRVSFPGGNSYA